MTSGSDERLRRYAELAVRVGANVHPGQDVVVTRYQASDKFEYFAVRNSVGLFDTSPLYKYRIAGRDALRGVWVGVVVGMR